MKRTDWQWKRIEMSRTKYETQKEVFEMKTDVKKETSTAPTKPMVEVPSKEKKKKSFPLKYIKKMKICQYPKKKKFY